MPDCWPTAAWRRIESERVCSTSMANFRAELVRRIWARAATTPITANAPTIVAIAIVIINWSVVKPFWRLVMAVLALISVGRDRGKRRRPFGKPDANDDRQENARFLQRAAWWSIRLCHLE